MIAYSGLKIIVHAHCSFIPKHNDLDPSHNSVLGSALCVLEGKKAQCVVSVVYIGMYLY